MMLVSKEKIETLKQNDLQQLYQLLQSGDENGSLLFLLENLGHLPNEFDKTVLLRFLTHPHDKVRLGAIKNLGKLSDPALLDPFFQIALEDENSMVRREAVSSIGRLRSTQAIPVLLHFLNEADPKIVLQAIRGLLVFRENSLVTTALNKLANHPNEMIKTVIAQESAKKKKFSAEQPHIASPEFMKDVVVHGDVCEVLQHVPNDAIHLTFTSPPYYNARDYSIYPSYNAYLDFLTRVFEETHRITKTGRFLVVNTSPIIIPRVSRAHSSKRYPIPFDLHSRLVSIGWEFIDDIVWLKPEYTVKNRNGGFMQHRKPLAYKPNMVTEYLMVYRKETTQLIDWNIDQYPAEIVEKSRIEGEYESTNVWRIDPTFDRVHTAVFPIELCKRVIQFYSYHGDLLFDPFGGSGTLGRAARSSGRYFFMTEKEANYVERMKENLNQPTLFSKRESRFITVAEFAKINQENQ